MMFTLSVSLTDGLSVEVQQLYLGRLNFSSEIIVYSDVFGWQSILAFIQRRLKKEIHIPVDKAVDTIVDNYHKCSIVTIL
jgi:hypothetical protein